MRSLVLEEARQVVWRETPEPQRRHEREAIVRPLAVATCDLDQPMIFGQTPFAFPIHLAYLTKELPVGQKVLKVHGFAAGPGMTP